MRVVVALGGNALLRRGEPMTAEAQRGNMKTAARALAPIAEAHDLVVTHGNGPQVGLLALQALAYKPEEVYAEVNNIAPDLIVYFGNLSWRSVGSLGLDRIHTFENDTGPDDANHAQEGMYIYYDPRTQGLGLGARRHLMDVAPTILDLMGLPVPADMRGRSFA